MAAGFERNSCGVTTPKKLITLAEWELNPARVKYCVVCGDVSQCDTCDYRRPMADMQTRKVLDFFERCIELGFIRFGADKVFEGLDYRAVLSFVSALSFEVDDLFFEDMQTVENIALRYANGTGKN